jgi:hypothetical protein
VYLAQASPQHKKLTAMITKHLIDQIKDLLIRLDGEEITQSELDKLNNCTIEQLEEKRNMLLIALQF